MGTKPSYLSQAGRERAKRFQACLGRASRHPGEKEIHDLRVSIRRLLAWLAVAGTIQGAKGASGGAARRVKELMSPLGRLRDAQVKIEWLKKLVPEGDEASYRYALWALGDSIGWRNRVGKFLREIDKRRYAARLDGVRLPPLPPTALRAKALGILGERGRRVGALAAAARRAENVDALHRMRLAFKEYRYSVEVLAPLLPGVTAKTLDRLHAFQTRLGDIHDLDVLLDEAGHFRRRVLEIDTESGLESRIREIRRREFRRLAPLLSSPSALSKRVLATEPVR